MSLPKNPALGVPMAPWSAADRYTLPLTPPRDPAEHYAAVLSDARREIDALTTEARRRAIELEMVGDILVAHKKRYADVREELVDVTRRLWWTRLALGGAISAIFIVLVGVTL